MDREVLNVLFQTITIILQLGHSFQKQEKELAGGERPLKISLLLIPFIVVMIFF